MILPDERLQTVVTRLVGRGGVRHAVLALEAMDGSVRWSGAAGEARPGGVPMGPEIPYFIASIDKLYIATCTLKLVERGLVVLDSPVAGYLPAALTDRIHVMDGVDRSGEITLRHLLGHTSGLADYLEDRPRGGRSFVERLVESGEDAAFDVYESMRIVREELTPHFPPQDLSAPRPRIRYCDTNYQLLIALLETVHGRPLHEVYAGEVFGPAGMRHTWFPGLSEPLDPVPVSAALWFGDETLDLPRVFSSLNSIHSTAADQLASLRAILRGDLFDEPATVRVMQHPWKRFALPRDPAALRAPSWPIEYGHGMVRFALPRWLTPFRRVPAVVGHTGSTGSWLFYCEELDVLLAGTVDQGTAGAVPFRQVVGPVLHAIGASG